MERIDNVKNLNHINEETNSSNMEYNQIINLEDSLFDVKATSSFSGYTIRDIFSNKITLAKPVIDAYKNWFTTILVQDDEELVSISYKVYKNKNVWDTIYVINQMYKIWDLPKSEDTIQQLVDEKLKVFVKKFPNLPEKLKEEKKQEILAECYETNEKFRYLKIIKPKYLSQFLQLAKSNIL